MYSGGLVNRLVNKFQAVATQAQLGANYSAPLDTAIEEVEAQVAVLANAEELRNAVAGRLEMEAVACEAPINGPTAPEINLVRAKVLREAAARLREAINA